MDIIINTEANDMNSFQSTNEKYMVNIQKEYVQMLDLVEKNYKYCDRNGITPYIKYPSYEKEQKKRTEKNKFGGIQFERDDNHMPICPAGYAFAIERMIMKTDEY